MFKFLKSFFGGINAENSSMGVQCDARDLCEMRHTQLCETCEHNCGVEQDKNYYKQMKE